MSPEITHNEGGWVVSVEADQDQDARVIEMWLHGRCATTQKSYRAGIGRFCEHTSTLLRHVSLADLQAYADTLDVAGLSPATRRRLLASFKSLFSFGHRLGYLQFDTAKPLRLPALKETLAERVIDEAMVLRMIDWSRTPETRR